MKKISVKLAGVFTAVAFAVTASSASAVTITPELIALLQGLGVSSDIIATLTVAQGGSTGGSSAACGPFTRDLTVGSTGSDVTTLQNFLMGAGQTIPAGATGYFGSQTVAALSAWQAANGVSPAVGYFGPITRSAVAPLCSTTTGGSTGGSTGSSSDLEGGAGSISDADFIAGISNEEVGENQDDVEVVGLEIEAGQDSDIELTAVSLDFDKTTSGGDDDFDDYAAEVSIWFDGDEVARLDADEFDDDNNYSRTVSLDNGAIIRADKTGDLVVAVSGISNLDSNNEDKTWTVQVESVRFRDAQGAIITESAQGDIGSETESFTFESFASAADLEFRVQSGDDTINDSRVIQIDDNDETDNVALFSFDVRVEGGEVELKDLPITSTIGGTATELNDVFSKLSLEIDGDEVGTENPTASTTVVFDDIDVMLDEGTYEFVLYGDIKATSSATLAVGDTISFAFGETEMDRADFDVEDENGDNLADADTVGTETGETHTLFVDGIDADLNSATKAVAYSVDSTDNDRVELSLVFDVENFGDDELFIPNLATFTNSSSTAEVRVAPTTSQGIGYALQFSGTTSIAAANVSHTLTSTADSESNSFSIDAGDTETFTLKVIVTNKAAATIDGANIRALLSGIGWADTDSATSDSVYTTDLNDFETDYAIVAD